MVGETLHMKMWQRRMPQTELAQALGMNQSTLSKKLRGKVKWTLSELYEVAGLLDCNVAELLPPDLKETGYKSGRTGHLTSMEDYVTAA